MSEAQKPWTPEDEVLWKTLSERRAADLSKFRVPVTHLCEQLFASINVEEAYAEDYAQWLINNCHAVVRVLLPFCALTPIPKDLEEMTK